MERARHRFASLTLAAALAAAAQVGNAAASLESDFVRVPSRTLDAFLWRPGSDVATYRQVILDAPRVEFTKDWLRRMNEGRGPGRRLAPADAARLENEMELSLIDALKQALIENGHEIVTSNGPGTLRLSPSIVDLDINSPFVPTSGIEVGIVHRNVGAATMRLEVRDAPTGTLLARIVDREVAHTIGRYERATSVSNLFWFEGMFRKWARESVDAIRAAESTRRPD
jgi:hypothetical protein